MLHGGRKWEIRRSLLMTAAVLSVGGFAAIGAKPAAADHAGNVKLINMIYKDLVLRPVKASEIPNWVKLLDKGQPPNHVAGQVMRMQTHRNQQVRRLFKFDIMLRDATDPEVAL